MIYLKPKKNRNETIRVMLDEFINRLRAQEGDNLLRVVLFGSVARGEDKDDSDVDVFVLLDECEDEDRIVDIATDVNIEKSIERVFLSILVFDTIEMLTRGMHEPVIHEIEKEGILLYAS